jgi:hypothetical protein
MKITTFMCIIREIDTENNTVLLYILDLGISVRYDYDSQKLEISEDLIGVKVNAILHDGKVAKMKKVEEQPPSDNQAKKVIKSCSPLLNS